MEDVSLIYRKWWLDKNSYNTVAAVSTTSENVKTNKKIINKIIIMW